jgi:hypothetical protein
MINDFYFSIEVTKEQIDIANELVEYSLKHHPITNIWDSHKKDKTKDLRLTGTIGEIVFADLYSLQRPTRSFGAIDGQDYGKDFVIENNDAKMVFDIKTMHRKSNVFYKNFVLNIPSRNIHRGDSITDYYNCISLSENNDKTIASIIGYLKKQDIIDNKIGILYKKGTKRIRKDGTSFTFFEDTYEVFFENIKSPIINSKITNNNTFKKLYLR